MHFTLVTAVAILAHTTQSFAAPIHASYEIQDLSTRADNKDNWKKAVQSAADHVPDAVLNVPVRSNTLSVFQKVIAAAKQGSSSSTDTHNHTPRPPGPAPVAGPAGPGTLTRQKSGTVPAAPPKKPSAEQGKGDSKKSSKRDVIPDLQARDLEIDELD